MTFDPRTIQSTFGYGVHSLSCLVYGPAGAGKTSLARTTGVPERTLILAAEPGLLPLRDLPIKWVEIDSLATLDSVLTWLESIPLDGRWVITDSISEIAERCLADLKAKTKDPRQAYGEVQDRVLAAMKRIRSLPCNTVTIAKAERVEDSEQRLVYGPMFPGKKLAGSSVYEFDLVLPLRVGRDDKGRVERWLQTAADGKWEAKDRSGSLLDREPPDLAHIARKVLGQHMAEPIAQASNQETST